MPRGFDRERTTVHKLQYHFIWCPKYRKSVLEDEVRDRLKELIEQKAENSIWRFWSWRFAPTTYTCSSQATRRSPRTRSCNRSRATPRTTSATSSTSACRRCGRARPSSQVRATCPAKSLRNTSTPKQVSSHATDCQNQVS